MTQEQQHSLLAGNTLAWAKKAPTEAGWYFLRRGKVLSVVHVFWLNNVLIARDHDHGWAVKTIRNAQWSEAIPLPR